MSRDPHLRQPWPPGRRRAPAGGAPVQGGAAELANRRRVRSGSVFAAGRDPRGPAPSAGLCAAGARWLSPSDRQSGATLERDAAGRGLPANPCGAGRTRSRLGRRGARRQSAGDVGRRLDALASRRRACRRRRTGAGYGRLLRPPGGGRPRLRARFWRAGDAIPAAPRGRRASHAHGAFGRRRRPVLPCRRDDAAQRDVESRASARRAPWRRFAGGARRRPGGLGGAGLGRGARGGGPAGRARRPAPGPRRVSVGGWRRRRRARPAGGRYARGCFGEARG